MLSGIKGATLYNISMELIGSLDPGNAYDHCYYESSRGYCTMGLEPFPTTGSSTGFVKPSIDPSGLISYTFGSTIAGFSVPYTDVPVHFSFESTGSCNQCGNDVVVTRDGNSMTFCPGGEQPCCTILSPFTSTCSLGGNWGYNNDMFTYTSSNNGNFNITAVWSSDRSHTSYVVSTTQSFTQKMIMSFSIFDTCTTVEPTPAPTLSPTPAPGQPTMAPTPSPTSNFTEPSEATIPRKTFDVVVPLVLFGGVGLGVVVGLCFARRSKNDQVPLLHSTDYQQV